METSDTSPSQARSAGDKNACPTRPYLSVVVTARNDDHGGNLRGRMQAFVNGWMAQCRRHQLPAELIMVEWNPPPDRPPLASALAWPDSGGFCDVRIIEVPAELHRRFRHWRELPLYQMIAKNVGIRRARGEFVVATNIDVLFSDELMRFFAERRLERGKMYRVSRWDVMADVPVNAPIEEQLAYCESHLIRLNARDGTFRLGPDGLRVLEVNDIAPPDGPVQLGAGWFEREMSGEEPFRWVDNDAEFIISSAKQSPPNQTPANQARILVVDVEPGPGADANQFVLELRDVYGKVLSEIRIKRRSVVTFALPNSDENIRVCLHTGSGGNPIESDLRILNFRIFRCTVKLDPSGSSIPEPVADPVTASVSTAESWGARIGRSLRLAREIWRGNPDVHIRLPMSQARLANLQLKQDGSGVSFSARALKRSLRGANGADDFLPPGMRARWKTGWYPLEYFKGETFRWMQKRGEVVWLSPDQSSGHLVLHVEPGPAVGFKPCQVEICDQRGEVINVQEVRGRSTIRIPISGGLAASLEVRGGGSPKNAPGDPRTLALRVFGCTWEEDDQADAAGDSGQTAGDRARFALQAFPPEQAFAGQAVLLHTNACGDFTLLAREHWMDLRAYPELDCFSMNIDSFFCWMAHHGGAREEILEDPMRIYHIEHETGSGWTPEGQQKLFDRIAAKGIPWVGYQEVVEWARTMKRFDAPIIMNREGWGLAEEELKETAPG